MATFSDLTDGSGQSPMAQWASYTFAVQPHIWCIPYTQQPDWVYDVIVTV